jgi:hypothetical protein
MEYSFLSIMTFCQKNDENLLNIYLPFLTKLIDLKHLFFLVSMNEIRSQRITMNCTYAPF